MSKTREGKTDDYAALPLAGDIDLRATGRIVHLAVMRAKSPQSICPHCHRPVRSERRRFLLWTKTVIACPIHGEVKPLVV